MKIVKHIVFDIHFNPDEEQKAINFVEKKFNKGFEEVDCDIKEVDGKKIILCNPSGSDDFELCAQIISTKFLKNQ